MAKIEIKDASGKKVNEADLNAAVFGIEPNVHVMHTVVRAYRAAMRQGTHDTKTRGEVRGGGTVFGPHPRSYAFRVNRKEVKLAMRSALSAKLADEQLIVVDGFNFEKPSTKQAAAALKALGCDRRTTIVVADDDVNTYLSFRNIERVNIIPVSEANTMELVDNKVLVLTAAALERLEEVLA